MPSSDLTVAFLDQVVEAQAEVDEFLTSLADIVRRVAPMLDHVATLERAEPLPDDEYMFHSGQVSGFHLLFADVEWAANTLEKLLQGRVEDALRAVDDIVV
jgi:hypothetical protein